VDEAYLRANSRLPGPRANLELLAAAGEKIDRDTAFEWAAREIGAEPSDVFIVMVGLLGLGRLLAEGDKSGVALMRRRANDENWRVREGVAIGLQRLGRDRPEQLAEIAREWVSGGALEARAAVAAVAEPPLLKSTEAVEAALVVLDAATAKVGGAVDRKASDIKVLRQALGYAWSVVVAADPELAMPRFVAWEEPAADDPDIDWILRENRSKSRMKNLLR
jgi:hypothetical protein